MRQDRFHEYINGSAKIAVSVLSSFPHCEIICTLASGHLPLICSVTLNLLSYTINPVHIRVLAKDAKLSATP